MFSALRVIPCRLQVDVQWKPQRKCIAIVTSRAMISRATIVFALAGLNNEHYCFELIEGPLNIVLLR
jgi:hypothetical protein